MYDSESLYELLHFIANIIYLFTIEFDFYISCLAIKLVLFLVIHNLYFIILMLLSTYKPK